MDSADSAADPLVLDLHGTGAAPLRLVGGKALNLGKLVAAGLPVPRGFCLTTVAYQLAAPAPRRSSTSGSAALWSVSMACAYGLSAVAPLSSHITSRLRNTGGPSQRAAILAAKSEVSGRPEFSMAES